MSPTEKRAAKLAAVASAIDKFLSGYWLVKNLDSPEVWKEWREWTFVQNGWKPHLRWRERWNSR